jgi:hypothetical protein
VTEIKQEPRKAKKKRPKCCGFGASAAGFLHCGERGDGFSAAPFAAGQCPARNFSASSAAMQPMPALVTA